MPSMSKGESNSPAGNIIQILADLPEYLRRPMLRKRLQEFYSMDAELRRETIRMALQAAPSVHPKKLATLLRTWLELLAEFDAEKRSLMFHTYCEEIINQSPSQIQKLDMTSITDAFLSISESKSQSITDSIHEVLLSVPNRDRILGLAPDHLLTVLKLR